MGWLLAFCREIFKRNLGPKLQPPQQVGDTQGEILEL